MGLMSRLSWIIGAIYYNLERLTKENEKHHDMEVKGKIQEHCDKIAVHLGEIKILVKKVEDGK